MSLFVAISKFAVANGMTVEVKEAFVKRPHLVDSAEGFVRMDVLSPKDTPDEIWLLQHPPVYTLGIAGRSEHLLQNNGIVVIRTDRGGQITYHGPGQIVAYLMLDMRRLRLGVRELVRKMEGAVVDLLREYGIDAQGSTEAPGVYVGQAKIAALGLKVRKGCCYHGVALNVDMNMLPFSAINPCGYSGLQVTQTKDLGVTEELDVLREKLADRLRASLTPT